MQKSIQTLSKLRFYSILGKFQLYVTKSNLALIFIFVSSLFLAGCASTAHHGNTGNTGNSNIIKLSKNAERELSTGDSPVAVVFGIDRNGKIQVFVPADSQTFKKDRPIKAAITRIGGISIVASKNPKVCWATTSGDEECVEWEDP